jgi:hypothetical protein
MKTPLRTKSVGTKVSEAEFALLEERARGAGMRLGEWVREAWPDLIYGPTGLHPEYGCQVREAISIRIIRQEFTAQTSG